MKKKGPHSELFEERNGEMYMGKISSKHMTPRLSLIFNHCSGFIICKKISHLQMTMGV
jgi:hypothetical protein